MHPDPKKEEKIDTGYGIVRLIQKTVPEEFENPITQSLTGITRVTLTADVVARRGAAEQTTRFLCLSCGLSASGRRAFTLLEITLAVAILGMMALAIFRFVSANLVAVRLSTELNEVDAGYAGLARAADRAIAANSCPARGRCWASL